MQELVLLPCFVTISKKKKRREKLKSNWTLAFLGTTFPGEQGCFYLWTWPPWCLWEAHWSTNMPATHFIDRNLTFKFCPPTKLARFFSSQLLVQCGGPHLAWSMVFASQSIQSLWCTSSIWYTSRPLRFAFKKRDFITRMSVCLLHVSCAYLVEHMSTRTVQLYLGSEMPNQN